MEEEIFTLAEERRLECVDRILRLYAIKGNEIYPIDAVKLARESQLLEWYLKTGAFDDTGNKN